MIQDSYSLYNCATVLPRQTKTASEQYFHESWKLLTDHRLFKGVFAESVIKFYNKSIKAI